MPRSHRIFVSVPELSASSASGLAETAGHSLTPYLHAAMVTAVRAAEAGRRDLLPPAITMGEALDELEQEHNRRNPRPVEPFDRRVTKIAITASREDRDRWERALEAAGSSLFAVTYGALSAFVASGGSWVDTVMPGEAGRPWRTAGAA